MDALPQEIRLYSLPDHVCPFVQWPFVQWLEGLKDTRARDKIRQSVDRLSLGNLGDFKAVGQGVLTETKKTQNKDILRAQQYWMAFQRSTEESKDAEF